MRERERERESLLELYKQKQITAKAENGFR